MSRDIWKYITVEQCNEFLLSFQLLGETTLSNKEQITCLYSLSNTLEKHYEQYTLVKSNGGTRKITKPDERLKLVQKNILANILSQRSVSIYATAYQKGVGLIMNAQPHTEKQQILKLDIEDFFDSISFSQVYAYGFPRSYFPKATAGLLTNLCCYNHCLPQGAPTSPMISNLVLRSFDDSIGQWCVEKGISYTRFCDDMTFSGTFDATTVKNKVQAFLVELGFSLNKKKTRVISKHEQQTVTGIVVNEKSQAPRTYRKQLRQEIYYCMKFGVSSHIARKTAVAPHLIEQRTIENYLLSLLSKTNFILQINPLDEEFLQARTQLKVLLTEPVSYTHLDVYKRQVYR
uniref:RNA-directed DNA polymerase n=1 Tax=Candidatus Enterococcus clewellii TaxID=1834193 RepID=A0A242K3P2_9ENTE|nr:reverse transcriptase family protein [Enterococcus sp. 9E7_DIV0242]OTP11656.1 hypothetical protein A5888_003755 [Enterococcus sp. 9E7_DIV0242]